MFEYYVREKASRHLVITAVIWRFTFRENRFGIIRFGLVNATKVFGFYLLRFTTGHLMNLPNEDQRIWKDCKNSTFNFKNFEKTALVQILHYARTYVTVYKI